MLNLILQFLLSVFPTRQALILENAAPRHQIDVLQRNSGRLSLRWRDRAFWDVLCSICWPYFPETTLPYTRYELLGVESYRIDEPDS